MINVRSFNKRSTTFFHTCTFNSNKGKKSIESCSIYLSLVTGEFIAYRNNEYGSDDDEDEDDDNDNDSINSFIFTIFVKPIKKK